MTRKPNDKSKKFDTRQTIKPISGIQACMLDLECKLYHNEVPELIEWLKNWYKWSLGAVQQSEGGEYHGRGE